MKFLSVCRMRQEIRLREVVNRFEDMGATVHVTIEILNKFDDYHKTFNMLGNIPVVTFSNQPMTGKCL